MWEHVKFPCFESWYQEVTRASTQDDYRTETNEEKPKWVSLEVVSLCPLQPQRNKNFNSIIPSSSKVKLPWLTYFMGILHCWTGQVSFALKQIIKQASNSILEALAVLLFCLVVETSSWLELLLPNALSALRNSENCLMHLRDACLQSLTVHLHSFIDYLPSELEHFLSQTVCAHVEGEQSRCNCLSLDNLISLRLKLEQRCHIQSMKKAHTTGPSNWMQLVRMISQMKERDGRDYENLCIRIATHIEEIQRLYISKDFNQSSPENEAKEKNITSKLRLEEISVDPCRKKLTLRKRSRDVVRGSRGSSAGFSKKCISLKLKNICTDPINGPNTEINDKTLEEWLSSFPKKYVHPLLQDMESALFLEQLQAESFEHTWIQINVASLLFTFSDLPDIIFSGVLNLEYRSVPCLSINSKGKEIRSIDVILQNWGKVVHPGFWYRYFHQIDTCTRKAMLSTESGVPFCLAPSELHRLDWLLINLLKRFPLSEIRKCSCNLDAKNVHCVCWNNHERGLHFEDVQVIREHKELSYFVPRIPTLSNYVMRHAQLYEHRFCSDLDSAGSVNKSRENSIGHPRLLRLNIALKPKRCEHWPGCLIHSWTSSQE